jgi:hypothetical protein
MKPWTPPEMIWPKEEVPRLNTPNGELVPSSPVGASPGCLLPALTSADDLHNRSKSELTSLNGSQLQAIKCQSQHPTSQTPLTELDESSNKSPQPSPKASVVTTISSKRRDRGIPQVRLTGNVHQVMRKLRKKGTTMKSVSRCRKALA